jgi:hypothetical protein
MVTCTPSTVSRHDSYPDGSEFDDILALAREAGMLVTLDALIGREKYQSVSGSLASRLRFAEALRVAGTDQLAAWSPTRISGPVPVS